MADVLGCVVEGVSQIARAAFFHVSMMSVILTIASLGTRVALAYLLSATPLRVTGIWLSVPFGYLSRALWSAPPMVNAARRPVWVQTTAVSSGASGSAASRASTETVVERESRVVNTRVFTP